MVATDTTEATGSDRTKIYVNGLQVTQFSSASYPTLNFETHVNNTITHAIGRFPQLNTNYIDAYLADVHFIDGQALDPSSFGKYDSNNVWQPKEYSGTYGTNGFHLDFSDNSTAAALGTDTSGNGNDWTVNNLDISSSVVTVTATAQVTADPSQADDGWYVRTDPASTNPWVGRELVVRFNGNTLYSGGVLSAPLKSNGKTYAPNGREGYVYGWSGDFANCFNIIQSTIKTSDSFVDVPTNGTETDTGVGGEVRGNYATLNPIGSQQNSAAPLSDGNLYVSTSGYVNACNTFVSTIAVSSGKWYFEVSGLGDDVKCGMGIVGANYIAETSANDRVFGQLSDGYAYLSDNGKKANNDSATTYGDQWNNGSTAGCAFDADNGTIEFYKNGVSQGVAFTGIPAGSYYLAVGLSKGGTARFQTFTANFGQRPFAYTAPAATKHFAPPTFPCQRLEMALRHLML